MEDASTHWRKSKANGDFAIHLGAGDDESGRAWSIVVRFYSALHLVQAYLLTKGDRFEAKRHQDRENAMREAPELSKGKAARCYQGYRMLKDLSEQVWYEPGFRPRREDFLSCLSNLEAVRSTVEPKLADRLPHPERPDGL